MAAPVLIESDTYADSFPSGAGVALPTQAAGRYNTVSVANLHPVRTLRLYAASGEGILPGPTIGGEPYTDIYAGELVVLRRVITGATWFILHRAPVIAAVPPPPIPTPVVLPRITGDQLPGEVLTLDPGTWTGEPALEWVWTLDGVPIPGETGATYTVLDSDAGHIISAEVNPVDYPADVWPAQDYYIYTSAELFAIARCAWEYSPRTLASGTPSPPVTRAEQWAECAWEYPTRTTNG